MSDSISKKKAVALKYPENSPAPFITAIGKGELAEKVLKTAQMNDIMIVEDFAMTEFLSVQEVGSSVPPEAWETLAKIFAFVMENRN